MGCVCIVEGVDHNEYRGRQFDAREKFWTPSITTHTMDESLIIHKPQLNDGSHNLTDDGIANVVTKLIKFNGLVPMLPSSQQLLCFIWTLQRLIEFCSQKFLLLRSL